MRKIFLLYLMICVCFGALHSCSSEDVITDAVLSVSPSDELNAPMEGNEFVVKIETNHSRWTSICNAEWVKLRTSGNNLFIEVEANETDQERATQVIVSAGSKRSQINVYQNANHQVLLEPEQTQFNVNRKEKRYHLPVKSNYTDWTVEVPKDVNWLSVLARPRYGELIIDVKGNGRSTSRSCNLTLKRGEISVILTINQEGLPLFFIPYMNWGSNIDEVINLETLRDNTLTGRPNQGDPAQGIAAVPDFTFSTLSAAFPLVKYECMNFTGQFLYKTTLVAKDASVVEEAGFLKFLKEEGYGIKKEQGRLPEGVVLYENVSKSINMDLIVNKKENTALLIFYPQKEQTEKVMISENFNLGFPVQTGKTIDDVKKWENSNKGEYGEELTEALGGRLFYYAPNPHFARIYTFDEVYGVELKSMTLLLESKEKYLYSFGAIKYISKEFDKTIRNLGFDFLYYDTARNLYFYESEKATLEIGDIVMSRNMYIRCKLTARN